MSPDSEICDPENDENDVLLKKNEIRDVMAYLAGLRAR